jgi:hypothetical protein
MLNKLVFPQIVFAIDKIYRLLGSPFIYLLAGGLIGWGSFGFADHISSLILVLLLPLMWGLSGSRLAGFLLGLGYFLATARDLPRTAAIFLSDQSTYYTLLGWSMWLVASVLLTLPFFLFWGSRSGWVRGRGFVLASGVAVLPPLMVIGWGSPFLVAGVLFPDFGVVGLALSVLLMAGLAGLRWRWVGWLVALGVAANTGYTMNGETSDQPGWAGVNTEMSRLYSGSINDAGQLLAGMSRQQWIISFADTIPSGGVRLLPETMVGSYDNLAALSLHKVSRSLAQRGARLIVGAEVPLQDGSYRNGLVVLGANEGETSFLAQGIPVPYAMWRPWATDGAVADFLGPGNIGYVNNLRVGSLVCYEQFLLFSLIKTFLMRPDIVLAASNLWWARNTSIPDIQNKSVKSFSRLFGVNVLISRNI